MNVHDRKVKKSLNTSRENTELFVVEPSKLLFKVVINNYKQNEEPLDEEEDIVETMSMPPQPNGYIKFPNYDWF